MSSKDHSLSTKTHVLLDAEHLRIAVVVAAWNDAITNSLYSGTLATLLASGVKKDHIVYRRVPGAFELPLMAQWMAEQASIDAVICLGCIIQGDTPHFDFISKSTAQGIMDVTLKYGKPVVFGVLTTLTMKQAEERAGGKHGNKGDEAAVTALEMLKARQTQ